MNSAIESCSHFNSTIDEVLISSSVTPDSFNDNETSFVFMIMDYSVATPYFCMENGIKFPHHAAARISVITNR